MVHRTAIDLRLSFVKCCRATVPRAKQTMELKLMKLRRKGKKRQDGRRKIISIFNNYLFDDDVDVDVDDVDDVEYSKLFQENNKIFA